MRLRRAPERVLELVCLFNRVAGETRVAVRPAGGNGEQRCERTTLARRAIALEGGREKACGGECPCSCFLGFFASCGVLAPREDVAFHVRIARSGGDRRDHRFHLHKPRERESIPGVGSARRRVSSSLCCERSELPASGPEAERRGSVPRRR